MTMTLEQKVKANFAPQGNNREHLETELGMRELPAQPRIALMRTHKDASGRLTTTKVPHEPDLPEHVGKHFLRFEN